MLGAGRVERQSPYVRGTFWTVRRGLCRRRGLRQRAARAGKRRAEIVTVLVMATRLSRLIYLGRLKREAAREQDESALGGGGDLRVLLKIASRNHSALSSVRE